MVAGHQRRYREGDPYGEIAGFAANANAKSTFDLTREIVALPGRLRFSGVLPRSGTHSGLSQMQLAQCNQREPISSVSNFVT
jgi:hypothetical protein